MLFDSLRRPGALARAARDAVALMHEMYPLCRSITGDGVRRTLDLVGAWAPLQRSEVPSGTPVFDWEVPAEWNIADAYVADATGRRVIDFKAHTLHIVSYSTPVRARMTRAELEPHLHSLPEFPDRIPYRTSYYRENWGFCLRDADRQQLGDGPFDVVIDSSLAPGHLSYGECVVPGELPDEALIYTHVCHPSLANDNLTGIAVAAALARVLGAEQPRLTWRFVFAPGTIGSLTWLARNVGMLERVRAGLVIGLLGDRGALTYKRSRQGDALVDRVAESLLPQAGGRQVDFDPYGYDERQFCSPGFNLPVGRLTRTPNGQYDEYHTSADNMALVRPQAIEGALAVLIEMMAAIDANRRWRNLSPKGEPRLGKRGLYGSLGGAGPGDDERALLWLLNQSDGHHDLLAIARKSGVALPTLLKGAHALEAAGLLAPIEEGSGSAARQGIPR